VSARLESSHVLVGEHEAYLALTLNAPRIPDGARPPIHVAIVLDRSNSMNKDQGEKLIQARQAATQLIGTLTERDRFTVVVYNHEASILYADSAADARAKREAIQAISDLSAFGETNIADGLRLGADQLRRGPAMPGAVSRIVLLSDGEHTVPEVMLPWDIPKLAAQIAEHGISVSTVGIGLDFVEDIMTAIAVSGRGHYYFVEDASRLAAMFETELDRLAQTAATEVRVAVTPAPGVTVLDAYGYPMQQSGGAVLIPVADLKSAEQRKIVLRLRVAAAATGTMDIGRVETTFVQMATGARTRAEVTARAMVTRDAVLVTRYRDRDTVRQVEQALAARAIDEATALYQQGQAEAAQKRLEEQSIRIDGLADPEMKQELAKPLSQAGGNFAAAPDASSDDGKRTQKGNRSTSNDLYR
jgi:Ca-activated chloride channel family protein